MPVHDEINLRPVELVEAGLELTSPIGFRHAFEGLAEGVLLVDAATGVIENINPYLCRLLGGERDDFVGRELWHLRAFSGIVPDQPSWHGIIGAGFSHRDDLPLQSQNGAILWAEMWSHAYLWAEKKFIQCNIRDVTDRRAHLAEVERLTRLYAALSQVNHAIVRLPGREELFEKICNILVEQGGFRMAWIGWQSGSSGLIEPVASWGDSQGYLRNLKFSADDTEADAELTGTAFQTGATCVCNDLSSSVSTSPFWREEAIRNGFRASADFPLRVEGKVLGVMTVYADETGFFHRKEIALLEEMSVDISFGLANATREEARRQAEETMWRERNFSDAVLASLPGVLYLYDESGQFIRWNKNFESVTGYSAAEILTMHPLDFFRGREKELLAERIGEVFATGASSVEAEFVAKDGSRTPYYFTGNVTEMEGRTCLVGVGIDISERKRAEELLRQAKDELELRVAARTAELKAANESLRIENVERLMTMGTLTAVAQSLEKAKEEADNANRAKSDFLSRMSHELRTPMNAILGYGQLLELRGIEEISEDTEAILKAGRHLLVLINEVLDIARIEAGHLSMSPEPVKVKSVTHVALDFVRPLTVPGAIRLVNASDPDLADRLVFADQQRLRQVLVNLLSNAIKYNREGGEVFLSTSLVPGPRSDFGDYECEGLLRFSVRDTGPGISRDNIGKLFIPFERLGAERTRVEGTGIGLSLCKRLVHAMHGEIGVHSIAGEGSTFWVEVPSLPASWNILPVMDDAAEPPPIESVDQPLTILYIEDNVSNFAVIERAMELRGHGVKLLAAEQGSVGLDLARTHHPDIILLDLHLPDMMGDEVLQRLQAEPSTRSIPVIMLSADATGGQIERLVAAGAKAYLTKPLNLKQFFSVVNQTLADSGH